MNNQICLSQFVQDSSTNLNFITDELAVVLGIISAIEWLLLIWYITRPQPEWMERWFPA